MARLYVGGLTRDAAQGEIADAFARFGAVDSVWVARNPPGFAFVEMPDMRDAEEAVRQLDGRNLCGREVSVEFAKSKGRRGPPPGGRGGPPPPRGGPPPPRGDRYDAPPARYGSSRHGTYDDDRYRPSSRGSRRRSRSPSYERRSSRRSPSRSRGRSYDRDRSRGRDREERPRRERSPASPGGVVEPARGRSRSRSR